VRDTAKGAIQKCCLTHAYMQQSTGLTFISVLEERILRIKCTKDTPDMV